MIDVGGCGITWLEHNCLYGYAKAASISRIVRSANAGQASQNIAIVGLSGVLFLLLQPGNTLT
jgi:hypothetical protein